MSAGFLRCLQSLGGIGARNFKNQEWGSYGAL